MGPRSWDRGEEVEAIGREAQVKSLQWGRGLGTAERSPKCLATRRTIALQWGRGLGTAERHWSELYKNSLYNASMGPRSWDRGESIDCAPAACGADCFNGAAVLGPRRAAARPARPPRRKSFNGAAVLGPRRESRGLSKPHRPRRASMGPRSWDRGETRSGASSRFRNRRFNGAAVLGPRRGSADVARADEGTGASMGPRSWDRGEFCNVSSLLRVSIASMGPRSWDRGEKRPGNHRG